MDNARKNEIMNLYADNYRTVHSSELERRIGYCGPDNETIAVCAGVLTLVEVLEKKLKN